MIPVRMGTKKILKKNLRLINNKPLVSYIIEAAIASECFDEIYLNSEDEIFKPIADNYGIKFYKRPDYLATDEATNDDLIYEFLTRVPCEGVVQLLASSPFIIDQDIMYFVNAIGEYDTLVSVKNIQEECLYRDCPLNYNKVVRALPSQEMLPVSVYACSLMYWKASMFKSNMDTYGAGYHGANGNTGFHVLKGYSTFKIDNEEDFLVASQISKVIRLPKYPPKYYDPLSKKKIDYFGKK